MMELFKTTGAQGGGTGKMECAQFQGKASTWLRFEKGLTRLVEVALT
jgi:hypothetical protein